MIHFKHFEKTDYEAVCDFLIELNRDQKTHINWNWARFEWMYAHPECDQSALSSIGLWTAGKKVIGAAIYDMYFGEAFCGALPEYRALYPQILSYAYKELRDENGIGIAICDESAEEINAARALGFFKSEQTETVMSLSLNKEHTAQLPDGLMVVSLDPEQEPYDFQWLLWQGFDHGTNKAEFEQKDPIVTQKRAHLNPRLSLAAVNSRSDKAAYCCVWYHDNTDYAYIEPVCTVPSYRGQGVAKALLCEAFTRAKALGAERAYVISDTAFYKKLGFETDKHFTFYWKS